jgi:hypothetical protein
VVLSRLGASRYSYTHYYYGPNKYHHAYCYPSKSRRYVYYYNWEKRRYWGRYDWDTNQYSLLPEDKRMENPSNIKEDHFPAPVELNKVVIPGSDEKLTAPPKPPN